MSTEPNHNGNGYSAVKQLNFVRKDSKYKFVLSDIIMSVKEMNCFIIYAKQQLGKTSYALQCCYDIYRNWDLVFDNLYFDLKEAILNLRDKIRSGERIDVICLDDFGVHGSKYIWNTDRLLAQLLQNLTDVIGTVTRGIIITTPNPGNILKAMRDYEFYRVKIMKDKDHEFQRTARGYTTILLPSGKTLISRVFNDHYDVRLPNDVFERYKPIRQAYSIFAIDQLLDHYEQAEKQKQGKEDDDFPFQSTTPCCHRRTEKIEDDEEFYDPFEP